MTESEHNDGDSIDDWIEYQDNEIAEAQEDIEDRLQHLTGRVRDGMLGGECLQEHENSRLEAYLQGYADALQYASGRVERIDNLVKYAERHITEDSDD